MADKILVIDDSVSIRQMMSIILKGAGYEVTVAEDGPTGLGLFDDSFKAVITDYNMPNMNGPEVIRQIRAGSVNSAVPILIVTTESEEDKKLEGKRAGATGWLTKPFDKDQLTKTIQKIVGTVSF